MIEMELGVLIVLGIIISFQLSCFKQDLYGWFSQFDEKLQKGGHPRRP